MWIENLLHTLQVLKVKYLGDSFPVVSLVFWNDVPCTTCEVLLMPLRKLLAHELGSATWLPGSPVLPPSCSGRKGIRISGKEKVCTVSVAEAFEFGFNWF